MSVGQIPAPFTATQFIDAAGTSTVYSQALNLRAGVYFVTCVSTTVTTIDFWASDNTLIATGVTTSGSVTVALSTACARVTYYINTGSNIRIGIALSGILAGSGTGGTLQTITASGTYTPPEPGIARVCLIGGGGGGGGAGTGNDGGGGGGSGFATIGAVQLTGAGISVTLGAGASVNGTGGTTSFGALTAAGGNPGEVGAAVNGTASGGSGGSGGGGGSGGNNSTVGGAGGANGGNGGIGNGGAAPGGAGSGVSVAAFTSSTGGAQSGGAGGIYGGGGGGPAATAGGGGGGGVAASGSTGGAGRVFVLRWA